MDRRTFLKIAGMGSVAVAAGCNSHPERHLYTLVKAPDDMVTGESAWYATTCRECPAGCGVLAQNREGRVIKLEGNPLHPVNQGKLCARGQAALQAVYNPDRLWQPMLKQDGFWQKISYGEAARILSQRVTRAAQNGSGRVAMISEVVGQDMLDLFTDTLSRYGGEAPLVFEPFAFESLKFAHAKVFGRPFLPDYRLDQADVVLSLGADFLETWLSPVEYARKFKAMHALSGEYKGQFYCVGPVQTLTAANADEWLACRPGTEVLVVMALIKAALAHRRDRRLPRSFRNALRRLLNRGHSIEMAAAAAEIDPAKLNALAQRLLTAQRPLVLPTGTASDGAISVAADLASVLLNVILDPDLHLFDFDQRHRVEIAGTRADFYAFQKRLTRGPVELLLLNNVNPVHALPDGADVAEMLAGEALFTVAFSNFMDDTAAAADLIFPVQLPLESWDAYQSKQAMTAMLQPAMGRITEAPNIGDLFVGLKADDGQPATDYRGYLVERISRRQGIDHQQQWLRMVQGGGHFVADAPATQPGLALDDGTVRTLGDLLASAIPAGDSAIRLCVAPSLRFYDGRGANRPWLPEIPEPISQVAWQSMAWMSPELMAAHKLSDGDTVSLDNPHGKISLPVFAYAGLHPSVVAIQGGQGHTHYGRYARLQGANPVALLDSAIEPLSGAPIYTGLLETMEKTGPRQSLARVSGSRTQYERKIALSVPLAKAGHKEPGDGLTMNDFPLTLPLPEGYDHHRDIYPAHDHEGYRWGMVVDLDRCIGCSACVAACYAENNVGLVGQERIAQGREMAWLRIERYEDSQDPTRLIFLPMMCQHCDNAPCESVCPVYAPHHSKEGLNNQIYNRCIGTRFCAQNCPYKVRRFNWFDWQWPAPLDQQLNPDVTVRSKGVMEKCSFCIQRIKKAHNTAKNEKRQIREGEVIPACAQTCPTDALVFGNLMDPQSMVRKMIEDPRAYQVMGYLNTKPAVIYLKKVVQTL